MSLLAFTYSRLSSSLAAGLVNLSSDTLKVMLLSAYTTGTTQDDAQFVADVLAHATQTSGTGYTAGGQSLASVTWTQSGGTFTLDCADPTWATSSISASHALFYDSTPGSDATNPVLCAWDFGGTLGPSVASPFTLVVNASGLLTFTAV